MDFAIAQKKRDDSSRISIYPQGHCISQSPRFGGVFGADPLTRFLPRGVFNLGRPQGRPIFISSAMPCAGMARLSGGRGNSARLPRRDDQQKPAMIDRFFSASVRLLMNASPTYPRSMDEDDGFRGEHGQHQTRNPSRLSPISTISPHMSSIAATR